MVASITKANGLRVRGAWRQALSTRVPVAETSTHLESANSALHCGAQPQARLDQSELDGGFRCSRQTTCRWLIVALQALSTRVPEIKTSTHLEPAGLHLAPRGAAASFARSVGA